MECLHNAIALFFSNTGSATAVTARPAFYENGASHWKAPLSEDARSDYFTTVNLPE